MTWFSAIKVYLVSIHECLELNGILRCHEFGIREVVVKVVVNVWLMEPVRWSHGLAS